MKTYKFICTVWVQGDTSEDALNELHDEVGAMLQADNNLIALVSDEEGIEDVEGNSK